MDLKEAVAVAKLQVNDLFAPDVLQDVRLEGCLYDDHLGVWSLTIGFTPPQRNQDVLNSPQVRNFKVVRVSEANKSVLSVRDRPLDTSPLS